MQLYEFKKHLTETKELSFQLPDGTYIPEHFHITEVAIVDKTYIDCGGVHRHEQVVTLQIWVAGDTDHRLAPQKLLTIIDHSK
jgi:hypothetical protein